MSVLKVKNGDTWQAIQTIKGEPGTDGVTPVKGTDYWTAADKQDIIDEVLLAALPVAEGVSF